MKSITPRIIKFRAFDTLDDANVMYSFEDLQNLDAEGLVPYFDLLSGNFPLMKVMQFTGLTDKDGKEIYEGDLLRYESSKDPVNFSCFEVFFHDGNANSDYNIGYSMNRMYCHGNIAGGVVPSFKPKTTKQMLVIGNIFSNPELIEGDSTTLK